jgi:recombination endonuclease VII
MAKRDMSKYHKDRIARLRASGLCVGCSQKAEDGLLKCRKCRARSAELRKKKVEDGFCQVCLSKQVDEDSRTKTCAECKESKRLRNKSRREELRSHGICFRCGTGKITSKWSCAECLCKIKDKEFRLPKGTFKEKYLDIDQCQSCGTKISVINPTKDQNPHLDHDHATGVVRGLLCRGCNCALGFMKEDPSRIRALADYIEKHKKSIID